MDLDEAVALLAGTTVIPAGSRLAEARDVVLGVVERARAERGYTIVGQPTERQQVAARILGEPA